MKKYFAILWVMFNMLFSIPSHAQNLISNPGFEDLYQCPVLGGESIMDVTFPAPFVKDWVSITAAFIFNSCVDSVDKVGNGVPYNILGYRHARTGNGYAGILISAGIDTLVVRPIEEKYIADYLQVKLKSTLEASEWYCVSFYVAPAYNWHWKKSGPRFAKYSVVDRLGAYFSDTIPPDEIAAGNPITGGNGCWPVEPQVESRKGWILDDTSTNWTPITGVFQATGTEKWISIGCFRPESEQAKKLIYNPHNLFPEDRIGGNASYYVDDVNVNKISIGVNDGYNSKLQDTVICSKDTSARLYAPPGADYYEWNTLETTQSILSQSDIEVYWYKAHYVGCGIVTDTIKVVNRRILLNLGNDTTICSGNAINISPLHGTAYLSYEWNNGSISQAIQVEESGDYILKVEDACGSQSDTISVIINLVPDAIPSLDTMVCQFLDLGSLAFSWGNVRWFKSLTDSLFTAYPDFPTSQLGDFNQYVSRYELGCESEKSEIIFHVKGKPQFVLPSDTVFCPEYEPLIGVDSSFGNNYLWNTGDLLPVIRPEESGIYVLTVANECGANEDSIKVVFDECLDCAWIPNAFSPNGDGRNDNFGVEMKCPVKNYQLYIYDRWGKKIFESYTLKHRWTGSQQTPGTYFYRLQYRNVNNDKMIVKKGDVTLVR